MVKVVKVQKMKMADQYKTPMELERDALMAKNRRIMEELGLEQAVDAVKQTIDQSKQAKKKQVKKNRPKMPRAPIKIRRSERVQQLPARNYFENDFIERVAKAESKGKGGGGKARTCYDGLQALVDFKKDPVAAWQASPAGWKTQLGCPSEEAGAAAAAAAQEFAQGLRGKGRLAYVKSMSPSQVSGGFWCNIPTVLGVNYGTMQKTVHMICCDQAQRSVDSFTDADVECSICWQVQFLPRGEAGQGSRGMKGKGGRASRGSKGHGWSGGWRAFAIDNMMFPNDAVVFEVMDNVEGDAIMAKARAAAAAAAGKTGDAAGSDAAGAAAGAAAGDDGVYVYKDTPSQRVYVRTHIFRSSAYESEEEQQKREEAAEAAAKAAVEATKADAAEEEQQGGEQGSAAAGAAAEPAEGAAAAAKNGADAAAAEDPEGRASRTRKAAGGAQPKQKQDKQQKEGAPAAAAAAAEGACKKRGRQQEDAQPSSSKKKAKTGASAAGAAGKPSKAAAAGAGWVPQPANPKVLVPPPTEDEVTRNDSTESDFVVEMIMGHKVSKGKDLFLIRWEGFGPYWDSWEGRDCLNAAPNTYAWQGGKAAIPAKLRA